MKIAISTANLYYLPFETVLRIYKDAGYEYIELAGYWKGGEWEIAQHLKGINPRDVIRMVDESGLKISTFHDMGGVIEDGAESVISDLTYEYIKYYDFPCIVFHTPHKKGADKSWWIDYQSRLVNDLKALNEKILVCIENIFPVDNYYMPLTQPEEILDFLDTHDLYANIDTTHFAYNNVDITYAAEILRNRVKTIHLSDYSDGRQHLFIGDGNLDFASFFSKINPTDLHSVTIECNVSADTEDLMTLKASKAKILAEKLVSQKL